jgi:hydroxyacylglutathione hydrolase
VEVVPPDTPAMGDRSYLAHDGTVAMVIDPQRDIDRVLELAGRPGVTIAHVFETHLHNGYVTRGARAGRGHCAEYHVNSADPMAFDRAGVADGDVIEVGPVMRSEFWPSPATTFTHPAYALETGPACG